MNKNRILENNNFDNNTYRPIIMIRIRVYKRKDSKTKSAHPMFFFM